MPKLEVRTIGDFTVLAAVEIADGPQGTVWEVTVRSTDGKAEPQILGYWQCSEVMLKNRLGIMHTWNEEVSTHDEE